MAQMYCAFLRGINVNGITIKMDELKATFSQMGFADVKTILSTGNVIFSVREDNESRGETKLRIERELGDRFRYDAHVLLRGSKEMEEVVAAAEAIVVPEGCHLYSFICEDEDLLGELKERFDAIPQVRDEQFLLTDGGAFWIVPKGSTLSSEFGSKVLGSKKYKDRLTSRNINTIHKIQKAMTK